MTDFRSAAEIFVTQFIDYVEKHDIKDEFNKRTQKMERSPGVEALIRDAKKVFPERIGTEGTDKLSQDEIAEAIEASPNVIDTQEMFGRKIQMNGGVRQMLRGVLEGDSEATFAALEFIRAEDGLKEFHVPAKA